VLSTPDERRSIEDPSADGVVKDTDELVGQGRNVPVTGEALQCSISNEGDEAVGERPADQRHERWDPVGLVRADVDRGGR